MGRRLIQLSASTSLNAAVIVTIRISLSASCGTREIVSGRARASGAIADSTLCYLKGCFRDKPYIECTHTD